MINIQFVTVPLAKVRKPLHFRGRFRRPENDVCWLAPSRIFQRKEGCAYQGSVWLNVGVLLSYQKLIFPGHSQIVALVVLLAHVLLNQISQRKVLDHNLIVFRQWHNRDSLEQVVSS